MKTIHVQDFQNIYTTLPSSSTLLLDVRTKVEYQECHIPHAMNIPLNSLADSLEILSSYKYIYVHCRSGKRSAKACSMMSNIPVESYNIKGGILAWKEEKFPTKEQKTVLPLMRQVMIAAGSLVLLGTILALVIDLVWIYLSLFVGAGLLFAGVSGWCGMALLLAKMPWNTK
jgi:rhodanese-related sulfurtransferase